MKKVCNYTIIRFQPYPETGEFINIGIALVTNSGEFFFRVEQTKSKRVTDFFYTLDKFIFTQARQELINELGRVKAIVDCAQDTKKTALHFFKVLISPRETMVRFSEPGTMLIEDGEQAVNMLFDYYVNLSFATKEYQQQNLEKQICQILECANLKKAYKEARIGTDSYSIRFPFVKTDDGKTVQAIKPLSLNHNESSKIIDQGAIWLGRLHKLSQHGNTPKDMLFILCAPDEQLTLQKAYIEVASELADHPNVRVFDNIQSQEALIRSIESGLTH